jgi:hypothetical protein
VTGVLVAGKDRMTADNVARDELVTVRSCLSEDPWSHEGAGPVV